MYGLPYVESVVNYIFSYQSISKAMPLPMKKDDSLSSKDDDSFGEEQTTATNDDIDKVLQIHDAIIASN